MCARVCEAHREARGTRGDTRHEGREAYTSEKKREKREPHLRLQQQRHMVHTRHVVHADDLLARDVADHADLVLRRRVEGLRDQEAAGDLEGVGGWVVGCGLGLGGER